MIRRFVAALLLAALPAAAQEPSDLPARLAQDGLAPTEAWLSALDSPDPTQNFALGAVRFLRAIEVTLQTRWLLGINADRTELPVLRLPVPPNPDPQPFTAEAIQSLFEDLVTDLTAARAPLEGIGDNDVVSLSLPLWNLWFDVNMNGTQDEGEALINIAGRALTGRGMTRTAEPVVTFDTADAAWLAAYTHFLSAFAELVLAFGPAVQIARVAEVSAQVDALAGDTPYTNAYDMMFGQQIDRIAMIYLSLKQQPDPAHTRAAHSHLLKMIAQNRVFWRRVAAETDNNGEWIPNDNQQQGMGLTVPPGTGTRWLAVLDDAEGLLTGDKLIPHWRLREGAGLNMRRMFEEPIPIDLAEWVHGIGLLPYIEEGDRVQRDSWLDFERLVRGDSLMFVVFLN